MIRRLISGSLAGDQQQDGEVSRLAATKRTISPVAQLFIDHVRELATPLAKQGR
jgi:hypothetical protein